MTQPPENVVALARDRAAARQDRDFARADQLRDAITREGWVVTDAPEGYQLTPKPPYDVVQQLSALPDRSRDADTRRCGVLVLVTGWPDDLRAFCESWLDTMPDDVVIVALDLGNEAGAGDALHELARSHPGRIEEWHAAADVQQVGFGPAMNALRHLDTSAVQVVAETSTLLTGDAVSALLAALDDNATLGAVGWRGVNVDRDDNWRSFASAGSGEVDALLGYLIAFRRRALEDAEGYSPKARFYRNADIEVSLRLRAKGWRLAALDDEIAATQGRHRGYHDTDPAYRDRESRRTYDRILASYRGRDDLLAPRASGDDHG